MQRDVNSNTILPQQTRKTSNRQPNFTPNLKNNNKKPTKLVEGKKSERDEQKLMKKK